jgi:hypothetical protein
MWTGKMRKSTTQTYSDDLPQPFQHLSFLPTIQQLLDLLRRRGLQAPRTPGAPRRLRGIEGEFPSYYLRQLEIVMPHHVSAE